MALRILRIRDVQRATGLSRATIYRRVKTNEFPQPFRLTKMTVGWRDDEIEAWIAALPRAKSEDL